MTYKYNPFWQQRIRETVRHALNVHPRLMRIPLYSITDWHRSPISDSHPFDQPGT
ncbi:hypothetical protein V9Z41_09215 [Escherichia coli]